MINFVTLTKNTKSNVSTDYLKKLVETHNSGYGVAFTADGVLYVDTSREKPDVASIMSLMDDPDGFKDKLVSFTFIKADGPVLDEDLQPWTLLSSKEKPDEPLIVAMLAGEFPAFHQPTQGLTQTNAFWMTKKLLVPKVQQIHRLTKGDLQATIEELKLPNVHDELIAASINSTDESCTIHLISSLGDLITFHNGKKFKEYRWGTASDNLGYSEGAATGQPITNSKQSLAQKMANRSATSTGDNRAAATAANTATTAKQQEKPKETAPPKPSTTYGRPPVFIRNGTNQTQREWYGEYAEHGVPKNQMWKHHPYVAIKVDMVEKFKKGGGEECTEAVFVSQQKEASKSPPPVLPLTADEKKEAQSHFKRMDANGLAIRHPDELDVDEKDLPPLQEQTGKDLMEVLKWPVDVIKDMVENPKLRPLLILIIRDLQYNLIRLLTTEEQVDTTGKQQSA